MSAKQLWGCSGTGKYLSFLQPCDQFVNKAFKGAVRDTRDEVTSMAIANTKAVQFKLMCGVFGFHPICTQYIRKSFQVKGLFPVNWGFSKRFKNINDRINSKFSSDQFRSRATSTFSAVGSVHMRQTDRRTAETVLYNAKSVKEPSGMLQRVAIVISEQKTANTILMNLQPIQCAIAPARSKTSWPSWAPAENLSFGAMLEERRKIEEEKLRKEEEKQKRKVNHPAEKSKTKAKKIRCSCEKQRNALQLPCCSSTLS